MGKIAPNGDKVIRSGIPVVSPRGGQLYSKIYEGQLTNTFTTVNSKKTKHTEVTTEKGEQGWLFDIRDIGGGEITLTDPEENTLSMTSSQLLDIIALNLTERLPYRASDEVLSKHLDCILNVEDYMRFREISVRDAAVKQLKKDLRSLFNASTVATISYYVGSGQRRRKITEKLEIHYIDAIPEGQIRDIAHFRISLSFARYLVHSQVMPYPLRILTASKNKNFYYIGKKLAAHYNMNRRKKNAKSISIESLLKYTPEIPSFEEEYNRKRNYRQKCVEPLVNTLDEMVEKNFLQEWTLWHGENNPLSDEELNGWNFTRESDKDLFIHFELNNHPSESDIPSLEDINENPVKLIEVEPLAKA